MQMCEGNQKPSSLLPSYEKYDEDGGTPISSYHNNDGNGLLHNAFNSFDNIFWFLIFQCPTTSVVNKTSSAYYGGKLKF